MPQLSFEKFKNFLLNRTFNPKSVGSSIITGLVAAGIFSFVLYTFATPPSSPYSLGETLNPTCAPGDTNCTVITPAYFAFGSNNFSGTGSFTTTASISGGAITGTSFIIGANTLTTAEWAYLDGQDQAIKITSSPTFAGLTIDTNTLYIDSTNNFVGIGTTSPSYLLSVGSSSQFGVDSSGFALLPQGLAGTPSLTFASDTNTGLWSSGADILNLSTGGSERVRINSNGSVGSGTTEPGAKLDVDGTTGNGILIDMNSDNNHLVF
ncbi:MAG: hypothetical protein HYT36_03920, partial [Candidatus Staskawiczbacteria bacterium]|nr:hypothetical protein [Candidatus Staskawiczbacteria bacterium]